MDILILGGTQMLGRCLVEHLIKENKDKITLANRGITNPKLFDLETLIIDRNQKCESLSNHKFNCVVDFSCYNVEQFKNIYPYVNFDRYYLYISTVSVEDEFFEFYKDTNSAIYQYAINKKKVEEYIESLNNRHIITYRPCGIYGKYDYTNRFEEKNGKFYLKDTNTCVEGMQGYMSQEELASSLSRFLTPIRNQSIIHK